MVTITEVCVLASDKQHMHQPVPLQGLRMVMHAVLSVAGSHSYYGTFIRPQWELRLADWGHPDRCSDLGTGISETIHWTLHTQGP